MISRRSVIGSIAAAAAALFVRRLPAAAKQSSVVAAPAAPAVGFVYRFRPVDEDPVMNITLPDGSEVRDFIDLKFSRSCSRYRVISSSGHEMFLTTFGSESLRVRFTAVITEAGLKTWEGIKEFSDHQGVAYVELSWLPR